MLRLVFLLSLWMSATMPSCADCLLGKVNDMAPVFGDGGIYLPAKFDGMTALFKLDTGTVHSFLYQKTAETLGVPISEYGGQIIPGPANDIVFQPGDLRAAIASLNIGRLSGRGFFLPISAQSDDAKPGGLPVIGVLGEDFLSHFDIEIDLKNSLFALYRPEGCESANLAYWTKDYNVADMVGFNPREPHVVMSGKLNDSPIAVQMVSGRSFSVVSTTAAKSRGIDSDSPDTKMLGTVAGVHGENVHGWLGSFSNFTLDEEKISRAKIAFIKFPPRTHADIEHGSRLASGGVPADMLLGYDFLRAHHVLISHSQHKVYFSYEGAPPFAVPNEKGRS